MGNDGMREELSTLAYGLLALLAGEDCTGYDLMLRIQPFWQAKHSQIYPLLAKLEQSGCVRFTLVAQSDKPDKKVYTITDIGRDVVREWVAGPTGEPVTRDELTLKAYCAWLTDKETARRLVREREALYRKRLDVYETKLSRFQAEDGKEGAAQAPEFDSPQFGVYILLHKACAATRANIAWCEWVNGLLEQEDAGHATRAWPMPDSCDPIE